MSSLKALYNEVSTKLHSDGALNRRVESQLIKTVSDAFLQMMSNKSDEGYCFGFFIRVTMFKDLMNTLDITPDRLKVVYLHEWGTGAMSNHMHSDPYYQFYLFMLYYYIKEKNEKLINNCMINILIKLWNGRKKKYIPYCNKDVMAYVVNYMTSKKHVVNKYTNPLELIQNYFTPTLLKKYKSNIEKSDATGLKQMFEASFSRMRQIFVFNPVVDIKTGKSSATGGLMPMYLKAVKEGKSIKTVTMYDRKDDESAITFSDYISINNLDEIIDRTINRMTMNTHPKYSELFINNLYKDYGIKKPTIIHILTSTHNYKYKDQLSDIYSIILHQTRVISKDDVCSPDFTRAVNKLLKSKNNKDINKLKEYNLELLSDIMTDYLKIKPLTSHSKNHLIQLHKLLIRGLIYNLRSAICV